MSGPSQRTLRSAEAATSGLRPDAEPRTSRRTAADAACKPETAG
jgi:hypothetical protein